MISDKCSFDDFLEAVRDRSGHEMIHLTNQEATQAERRCFRRHSESDGDLCCDEYCKQLKGFILYLRHGVKGSAIKDVDLEGFQRVC